MSDFTPTTAEVRLGYAMQWTSGTNMRWQGINAFDRWLAARDAEIRADELEVFVRALNIAYPGKVFTVTVEQMAAARGGEQE